MALTEKRQPYEFLARWDQHGNLAGAHVGFRTVIYRDGEPINETVEPVQPVAVGAQAGIPLADVLDQIHIDALTRMEALEADVAAKDRAIAVQQAEIEGLRARIAALKGRA